MDKDQILNRLVIVAVNGISAGSYREIDVLKSFCAMPLANIVDYWDGLSDTSKNSVISEHKAELAEWVKSHRVV